MFENRIEIRNPDGIYGRIRIDQLGKVQSDTRNPIIASELEVLKITENRYSGIPTIRRAMREYNLPEPEFLDERGCFIVKLYKYKENEYNKMIESSEEKNLIITKFAQTNNSYFHLLNPHHISKHIPSINPIHNKIIKNYIEIETAKIFICCFHIIKKIKI